MTQLEAYSYFENIIESLNEAMMADDWDIDDEDEDDSDEEDEKEEKKPEKKEPKQPKSADKPVVKKDETKIKDPYDKSGIKDDPNYKPTRSRVSLSGVKAGLMGLATKYKEMNTKQKEVARNLDNAVKATVKAMQDSSKQERRESIIKGSMIPSFSKCIKSGIALIALGVATGTIIVPLIAAVAGFAINKKINDKERMLILDEIDTELEVIDKELALADSNNQIKKYRALLRYKKELQRAYQRIRYNIKVTKDISIDAGISIKSN